MQKITKGSDVAHPIKDIQTQDAFIRAKRVFIVLKDTLAFVGAMYVGYLCFVQLQIIL